MAKEYFDIHNSSAELAVTALNTFPFDVVGGRASFLHHEIELAVRSVGIDSKALLSACRETNTASFHLSLEPIAESGGISFTPAKPPSRLIAGIPQDTSASLIRREPYYQISYEFLGRDEATNAAAFNVFRDHHLGIIQEQGYVPSLFVLHSVGVGCGQGDIRLDLMSFGSGPVLTLMIDEQADIELAERAASWMKNLRRLVD